jgi:predicted nucleotidyltransferase
MASQPEKRIEGSHFSADTLEFLRLLENHQVRYVIVGGAAVIIYGYARFTGDIDFFYSTEPQNCERLYEALREFWDGDVPAINSGTELSESKAVIQFGRPPNRIDLLASVDGVRFEEAWESREMIVIGGPEGEIRTSILGVEKLIQNKRASGRPKDLEDLVYLERLSGAK